VARKLGVRQPYQHKRDPLEDAGLLDQKASDESDILPSTTTNGYQQPEVQTAWKSEDYLRQYSQEEGLSADTDLGEGSSASGLDMGTTVDVEEEDGSMDYLDSEMADLETEQMNSASNLEAFLANLGPDEGDDILEDDHFLVDGDAADAGSSKISDTYGGDSYDVDGVTTSDDYLKEVEDGTGIPSGVGSQDEEIEDI